jgi:hypothetical protein
MEDRWRESKRKEEGEEEETPQTMSGETTVEPEQGRTRTTPYRFINSQLRPCFVWCVCDSYKDLEAEGTLWIVTLMPS